jgi:hypothetical protein
VSSVTARTIAMSLVFGRMTRSSGSVAFIEREFRASLIGEAWCAVLPLVCAAFGVPGSRFPAEVVVVAVRWYLRYGLSYRDVEELL